MRLEIYSCSQFLVGGHLRDDDDDDDMLTTNGNYYGCDEGFLLSVVRIAVIV